LCQTQCAAVSALTALAHDEEMNSLQMLRAQLLPVLLTALPSAELDLQVAQPSTLFIHAPAFRRSGETMAAVRDRWLRFDYTCAHQHLA
jgi:hypothetical protein